MPRKTLYFGLAATLILSGAIALIGGIGWGQKAPTVSAISLFGIVPRNRGRPCSPGERQGSRFDQRFRKGARLFRAQRGQTDERVGFYVQGADKTVYFSPEGVTLTLSSTARVGDKPESSRWTVKLDFVGARAGVRPEGLEKTGRTYHISEGSPRSGSPAPGLLRHHLSEPLARHRPRLQGGDGPAEVRVHRPSRS